MSKYIVSDDQGNAFKDSCKNEFFDEISALEVAREWINDSPDNEVYISKLTHVVKAKTKIEVEVTNE